MSKTKQEVLKTAHKYNLEIVEDSLVYNESGLDFQVVFAKDAHGKEWVLRFPRREDVMRETGREKSTLDVVNEHIKFQAPKWEVYESDLIAYQKLDGIPMGTVDPAIQNFAYEMDLDNIPQAFYASLAKVFVDLHRIPHEKAALAGLPVLVASELRTDMKRRMSAAKEAFGVGDALWERWQQWLSQDDMWPEKTGFIHGEIHPGHILINEHGEVTGLIDWTESAVSDIANDFVVFYTILGEPGLELLISAYGLAGGYVWPRMKEHTIELSAAAFPLAVAEFAIKSGLDEYTQMAKQLLQ